MSAVSAAIQHEGTKGTKEAKPPHPVCSSSNSFVFFVSFVLNGRTMSALR